MKRVGRWLLALPLLTALTAFLAFAAYTYYVNDQGIFFSTKWNQNGTMYYPQWVPPFMPNFWPSGSQISTLAVPDGSHDYEVRSEIQFQGPSLDVLGRGMLTNLVNPHKPTAPIPKNPGLPASAP